MIWPLSSTCAHFSVYHEKGKRQSRGCRRDDFAWVGMLLNSIAQINDKIVQIISISLKYYDFHFI
jgi:hypothetical protein